MSFDSLLTHIVHIERDVETGADDDYGQAVTRPEVGQNFKAAIQPRSAREMALLTQAGAPLSDHTIFMRARLLAQSDKIVHDSTLCALPETRDLPTATFEIDGIRNAAGLGHHLEVDARLVGTDFTVAGS